MSLPRACRHMMSFKTRAMSSDGSPAEPGLRIDGHLHHRRHQRGGYAVARDIGQRDAEPGVFHPNELVEVAGHRGHREIPHAHRSRRELAALRAAGLKPGCVGRIATLPPERSGSAPYRSSAGPRHSPSRRSIRRSRSSPRASAQGSTLLFTRCSFNTVSRKRSRRRLTVPRA